jgi:hypothetical protein
MINVNKLAGLIASIGFCRAVFVGAMCLLIVHVVTFEEFVILALFGFAIDGVSVRAVKSKARNRSRNALGIEKSRSLQFSIPTEHDRKGQL